MSRLRALATAGLVAAVVFYALAAPLLREWFGAGVVIPAYVAVALLTGAVTYRLVMVLSRLADRTDDEEALDGEVDAENLEELVADGEPTEDDLEEMLGELRDDESGPPSGEPERESEREG